MRASPAAARGTRKIKRRQATVVISGSFDAGIGIIFFPLAESDAFGKRGPIPAPPPRYRQGRTLLARAATQTARSRPAPGTIPPEASRNPGHSFQNSSFKAKRLAQALVTLVKVTQLQRNQRG